MQRPRTPSNLSEPVHQRLNMYALAAKAAGVSALALAQPATYVLPAGAALVGVAAMSEPAEARIVYTKAHERFRYDSILLDLNHDGVIDFGIPIHTTLTDSQHVSSLYVNVYRSQSQNRIVGTSREASALRAGARIASANQGRGQMVFLRQRSGKTYFYGHWANGGKGVRNRYLGLKFFINGKAHYGWARVSVWFRHQQIAGVLTGYAYETIPNKPIIAGKTHGKDVVTVEPASLGHLARGASAISTWRKGGSQ